MICTFYRLRRMFIFTSQEEVVPVGMLLDSVVDPENGQIKAFWAKTPEGRKILFPPSIREWTRGHIIISSEKDFSDPSKTPRLNEVFKKEVSLIGNQVWNRKKFLGRVYDFSFDTISGYVMQIFVKKGFWWWGKKQVFHRSKIIKITEKGIFIGDNLLKNKDPLDVVDHLTHLQEIEKRI